MFRKILIAATVVGAALAFQSPARADVSFGIHFGNGHDDGIRVIEHKAHKKHRENRRDHRLDHRNDRRKDRGHVQKHRRHFDADRGYRERATYRLSNRELRHRLRNRGLYQIRILDRHHGVAKVIANNHRGYVAKYAVSTRNGRILNSRVIRPIGHDWRRDNGRRYRKHIGFYQN